MKRFKKYVLFFFVLLFFCICCLIYGYYEARNIHIVKYSFVSNQLPESFHGKKIVFVSDIHSEAEFPRQSVEKMVTSINSLSPDLIIVGGDLVSKNPIYIKDFSDEMKKLKSTYGIYFVLGNHDHWEDAGLILQSMLDCGFNSCNNQSFGIGV